MDGPSQHLESALEKLTQRWDHPCSVCGNKAMTRGARDHMMSQGHWKALWTKLQTVNSRSLPAPDIATGLNQPWVQRYEVPGGNYLFNHLTGGQSLAATAAVPLTRTSDSPRAAEPPSAAAPGEVPVPTHTLAPAIAGPPAAAEAPAAAAAAPVAAVAAPTVTTSVAQENGKRLLFKHSEGYVQAMNTKDGWRTYMTQPAKALEDFLYIRTKSWDHFCNICSRAMSGAQDHLTSQGHWKALWQRVQPLPPPQIAVVMEPGRTWVQVYEVTGGTYYFNHLTGGQEFRSNAPAASQAPSTAGPSARPEGAPRLQLPRAPLVVAPPSCRDARLLDPRLPIRNGLGYKDALHDKESWKQFMDAPAKQLEAIIYKMHPAFTSQCPVCESGMNGISNHLLSLNHWKKLWSRTRSINLDASNVVRWNQAWVERFDTPQGIYLFNHVTGEQAWMSELAGPDAPAPRSPAGGSEPAGAEAAPPPRSVGAEVVPHAASPDPEPAAAGLHGLMDNRRLIAFARRGCGPGAASPQEGELEQWHWRCLVMRPARDLQAALRHTSLADPWDNDAADRLLQWTCGICDAAFHDVQEHLGCAEHFMKLRLKAASLAADMNYKVSADSLAREGSPWLQDFGPAVFNHLTLETMVKSAS